MGVRGDIVKGPWSSFRLALVLGASFGGMGAIFRAGHCRMNSGTSVVGVGC